MKLLPLVLLIPQVLPMTPRPANAQARPWYVAVYAVPAGFSSTASTADAVPGEPSEFGPSRNTRGAAAAGVRMGRWEVAVGGSYGKHGLRGGDDVSSLTIEPAYTLATVDATGGYALLASAHGLRLQAFLGPSIQFWSGRAMANSRSKVGARGGLQLVTPVSSGVSLDWRMALGVAPSPVTQDELADLDSSYETGALWTRELGVGLRLAF